MFHDSRRLSKLIEEIEDNDGITEKPFHRKSNKKYGLAVSIKLLLMEKIF